MPPCMSLLCAIAPLGITDACVSRLNSAHVCHPPHRMRRYAVGRVRSYQAMRGDESTDRPQQTALLLEHHKTWLGEEAHQTRRQLARHRDSRWRTQQSRLVDGKGREVRLKRSRRSDSTAAALDDHMNAPWGPVMPMPISSQRGSHL